MGGAIAADGSQEMQGQSCHGNMTAVGASARMGWLDLPDCGYCHNRPSAGGAYVRDNAVFAPGGGYNAAAGVFAGTGLYKLSAGHGGIQCEACHGPTHAEYGCSEPNDNVQSTFLQGYPGKVVECAVCHARVPVTATGGPHGLHTIGQAWVDEHGGYAVADPASCATCHGADSRGTLLSAVSRDRRFSMRDHGGTKSLPKGLKSGCYDCHNGPGGW